MVALAMLLPLGWPVVRALAYGLGAYGLYAVSIWIWNWTGGAWIIMMRAMVWTMLGPALLFTLVEAVIALTRWDRGRRRMAYPTGFGTQWAFSGPPHVVVGRTIAEALAEAELVPGPAPRSDSGLGNERSSGA